MQRIIFTLILTAFFTNTFAQELNYPVKKIDGKEYYIYTVELQEGLYSVSKKFGVKQADIISFNPETEKGLKAGQVLIIPKITTTVTEVKNQENPPQKLTFHVVEKKQTLFSISRVYNISIDSIVKYNPQVERGLQVGDTLKIPGNITPKKGILDCIFGKKTEPTPTVSSKSSVADENFIIHTVKQKETLYSIGKLYDVEISEIIRLNPDSETTLKTGAEIKIPTKKLATNNDSKTEIKQPSTSTKNNESERLSNGNKTLRLVYLLPFMIDQAKVDAGNERFFEFYAGSLLAISEAKKKGISFEIFTFDTEKTESKMNEILASPEVRKADLIIGPAYTNQVAIMGDFARTNRVNTLIPFSSKIYDIETNPYLIQFNPGIAQTVRFVAEQLKTRYKNSNIIFAENTEVYNADDGKTFCDLLRNELNAQKRNFTTIEITNSEQLNFHTQIDKNNKNIIFFNTDKFSNVNMFLSWLGNNSQGFEVSFFRHTGWPDTEYSSIKSISATPFRNNTDSRDLNKFRSDYEKYLQKSSTTTSPSFDLLGYDLTSYFIDIMKSKGKDYISGASKLNNGSGIQSGFNFERNSSNSGIINTQLYINEK